MNSCSKICLFSKKGFEMKRKNDQTTKKYIGEKVSTKVLRNSSTGSRFWVIMLES